LIVGFLELNGVVGRCVYKSVTESDEVLFELVADLNFEFFDCEVLYYEKRPQSDKLLCIFTIIEAIHILCFFKLRAKLY